MEKKTVKQQNTGVVRTIITNAIYGRATQIFDPTVYISPNDNRNPTQVLGCTITSAQIKECRLEEVGEKSINVRVDGTYELHVWYEANGDTQVIKNHAKFSEIIPVKSLGGEFYENKQVMAWIANKPRPLGTMIVNKSGTPSISIQMEYELGVEVIGEAKIDILSYNRKEPAKAKNNPIENFESIIDAEDDD